MKAKILDINGKEKGTIELPEVFSEKIREDIVAKVLEAKKFAQPYAPSLIAGKQASARGKISHRRHVWKSSYGRGMARIPRKIMSRKGSQFNWIGASVPFARGGMRAHPPKIISRMRKLKINKKEFAIVLKSALAATANEKNIIERYDSLKNKKIKNVPLIVDGKIAGLKTKEINSALKNILGELYEIAIKKKSVRAGKGKLRGRKYKVNAGMLFVVGKDEKLKTGSFDVRCADIVGVNDLAKGGLGRLTIYTENAIKDLKERFK